MGQHVAPTSVKPARHPSVDIVRGAAIAGVVIFHIVWDMEFTGIISGIAGHPAWLAFGRCLAGTFMVLVGVSLSLAHRGPTRPVPFLRRLAVIVTSALAITIVTFFIFPTAFVYFGILHAIAAASVIGLLFLRAPIWLCIVAGAFVIALPQFVTSEVFDTRWLAWIGFAERVPPSNDFVPIFPWIGLTLLGIAATRLALLSGFERRFDTLGLPVTAARGLAWMGRKSLLIYLLHQPILLAIIVPLSWVLATR